MTWTSDLRPLSFDSLNCKTGITTLCQRGALWIKSHNLCLAMHSGKIWVAKTEKNSNEKNSGHEYSIQIPAQRSLATH